MPFRPQQARRQATAFYRCIISMRSFARLTSAGHLIGFAEDRAVAAEEKAVSLCTYDVCEYFEVDA